jgi:hypothetical protein
MATFGSVDKSEHQLLTFPCVGIKTKIARSGYDSMHVYVHV